MKERMSHCIVSGCVRLDFEQMVKSCAVEGCSWRLCRLNATGTDDAIGWV